MTLLFCGYCGKTMKYPQLVSSTTPASLQDWLEGELENLGIDGVYTRYILSLLKEDGADLDPPECEHLFGKLEKAQYKQAGNYHNLGKELSVPLSGKSRQKWKSWEKEKLFKSEIYHCNCMVLFDSEERKKSVAVECLKSASEQKNGIEKLIDEVCAKLKKIQSSEVSLKDCTKEELGTKVLLSSPQEQAEKYYAAFPALCGKIEPLVQLCQQQESKKVESVWERKKNSFDDGIGDSFYLREYVNTPSEEEFCSDCDNFDKHSDMSDKENDDKMLKFEVSKKISKYRNDCKPSFIVPKLKMSVHRIPISVKCLPFNPVNISEKKIFNTSEESAIQIDLLNSDKRDEINSNESNMPDDVSVNENVSLSEDKLENYNNAWENVIVNAKELDVLSHPATLSVSFKDSLEKEDYIYNKFAGKFNNQLASIWAQNVTDISNRSLEINYPLIFEVSLKENNLKKSCFSLKFLEQSIKDIKSIWTVSPDDFKLLSTSSSKLFPLAYLLSNNLISQTEIKNEKQALEENVNYLQDADDFIEVLENNDDDINEQFPHIFPLLNSEKRKVENTEQFSSFDLWKDHLYDEDCLDKDGMYSLWATPSSVSLLPLECNEKHMNYNFDDNKSHSLPWSVENSKDFDESCHYIQHNHWCSDDCIHNNLENKTSLNKTKCTLTYHKGESLFVEVTPSPKPKAVTEINKISSFEREPTEHDLLEPPTSDSDDLLTSPKTHFQPIHQDSLEMENVEDNATMLLTINTDSPEECEFDNLIILPETENCSEIQTKPDYLLEMDEYLAKKQNIYYESQNDIRSSSFKELAEKNPFENVKKIYNEELEMNNLSLPEFVEMLRNNYYKDRATNTEIPKFDCINSEPQIEDFNEIRNLIEKLNSLDNNKDLNTSTVEQFLCSENISEDAEMWRWSTNDSNDDWNLNEHSFTSWQNINDLNDMISSKDMEKLDIKKNLEALKKEIEEEEDELFRDITRIKNATCSSDTESPETIFGTYCGYENEYFLESKQWSEEIPDFYYDYNNGKQEFNGWNSSDSKTFPDQYSDSFSIHNSDLESGNMFPLVPADKVLYSSDLEDEWRRSSCSFSNSHNRKMKNRHKIISQKKPCSFYLEGSCRRSDCKYSHDLSKITCRFWEEGSCFKGITCPFLHGYSSEGSFRHEECRHRKCNYTLDSETDFPSLSTSAPQDIEKEISKDISSKCLRRKRRRGKVQHGLPISSSWPQQKGNKH